LYENKIIRSAHEDSVVVNVCLFRTRTQLGGVGLNKTY